MDKRKEDCPKFEDHTCESVLIWAECQVEFSDAFVDGEGKVKHDPENAWWAFTWKQGVISFCSLKSLEDEAKARKASALFVYLWCKGVGADIAAHCAEAYVTTYHVI